MKSFLFFVLLPQAQAFNTVIPEKSYADPPTCDLITKDARLRKYNRH
ncbi:MAG: hypothetical protein L7T84_13605 [Akkermansiaceae bacterium]|nr:hypothetical protein [Akkermansiaceae bacterium]